MSVAIQNYPTEPISVKNNSELRQVKAHKVEETANNAQHQYLLDKGVQAVTGLEVDDNGELVIPLLDKHGAIIARQFINTDGGTYFAPTNWPQGCFFPIGGDEKNKPLAICEDLASGLSLHESSSWPILVAFNTDNFRTVAEFARSKYPDRRIVICANNDAKTPGNPGITKAIEAAWAIDGYFAYPRYDGRALTWNDLHRLMGTGDVAQRLSTYRHPSEYYPGTAINEQIANASQERLPDGFFLKLSEPRPGLYHVEPQRDGKPVETWIGPPLQILGKTCDENGKSWGLLLEWHDPKGLRHTWAMRKTLMTGKDVSAWFGRLIDEGWEPASSTYARKLLTDYLFTYQTDKYVKGVDRTGWHDGVFVFPDEVIQKVTSTEIWSDMSEMSDGATLPTLLDVRQAKTVVGNVGRDSERIVLQIDTPRNPFLRSGTLDGWRETIGAWAQGNSRISLALCASLSAPLLEIVGQESGGINWTGPSSIGKTTALISAGSVWGKGAASGGYVQSWRATDNGLEGLAALHSDTAFCLDEMGQAPVKTVQEAAYMLANGMGKARSKQDGSAREIKAWRCMVLSTGEVGLAEKIAGEGGRVRAGQLVRLIDVPADAGRGLGIFEDIHGHESPQSFAGAIKRAASTHYGHAAREFITHIVQSDSIRDRIACDVDRAAKLLCPAGASGQVQRVAQRFAVCAIAGELAIEWGLLPWEPGGAANAAKTCFDAWLASRGGAGAAEDAAILKQVTLFLEQHGASRFQDVDKPDAICINRVGFRRKTEAGTEFYILPESWRAEVCKGVDHKRASTLLLDKGILLPGDGRNIPRRPPCDLPGYGRKRCYTLLAGDDKDGPA